MTAVAHPPGGMAGGPKAAGPTPPRSARRLRGADATAPGPPPRPARRQRGFGAIVAILLLVTLAVISAAVVRLGHASQTQTAADIQGERALLAAGAGLEWGLYQAFKGSWTACSGATQLLDLSADTGMRVAVSCDSTAYNEGESTPGTPQTLRVYTIDAVACPSTTACPDPALATSLGYVERRRQVQAAQ